MVIHEIKHPIEALQFLHGNQKENLDAIIKNCLTIVDSLESLQTLDVDEKPMITIRSQNTNNSCVANKEVLTPT